MSGERFTKLPNVRTTMVTKLKTNGVFKSRICLRGGTMPMIHQQLASAPTVRKEYLRLFCSAFVNISSMIWLQVDISKAFVQSDYLHPKDKVVDVLPEYIGLTGLAREGWIATNHKLPCYAKDRPEDGTKIESPHEHLNPKTGEIGILLNRPLYGSADAPLRWYIAIDRALKKAGYEVLNIDRCVFAKYASAISPCHSFAMRVKLIEAAISIRADDIIFVGHSRERKNFESRVSFLFSLHGEMEELMAVAPLVFCGIEAGLFPDRRITLSQQEFYRQIPELHLAHFAKGYKMVSPERVMQKRLK